ncbi:MAG: T9SS type A sorting domain-containing protein [Bacteroidota bacterium]|nr:T9SS type A sorting domain-containing protein [Bacteroidota bacterium]MDP4190952.1 T9SS type A sorting domain-containing protein [Bacteroidota bacterium]MDP4195363.1 T9SS type A sorting domain-containing protein [Bacteroidota bacterium]
MKKALLLLNLFLLPLTIFAQIPNGGFENWTNGNPDQWFTTNIPLLAQNVSSVTKAHSGSYALKGEVVNSIGGLYPPMIWTGSDATGFSVNKRYAKFTSYYQFNSVSSDRFAVNLILYKGGAPIGAGGALIASSASNYTQLDIPLEYYSTDVPDTCAIEVMVIGPDDSNTTPHLGSYFILDDLSLSGIATAVEGKTETAVVVNDYKLDQNYPNPFNPSTKISYSIAKSSYVSLKVYDMLGNVVSTLVNEVKPAGSYMASFNGSNLPSGFYLYELRAGDYSMTHKMLLLK